MIGLTPEILKLMDPVFFPIQYFGSMSQDLYDWPLF
jgi:hypothetical protein